jgi:hypothetical protein
VNLLSQFASRRDDHHASHIAWTFEESVQNGKDECGGLACACLCGTDNIASAQGGWDGGFLNRRGGVIASLFDSHHEARIEIELFEVQNIPFSQKSINVGKVSECSNKNSADC